MRRVAPAVLILAVLAALALAGRGYRTERAEQVSTAPVGTLVGHGTALQTNLHEALGPGFESRHPGVVADYEPVGSERGARLFLSGVASYAGVDAPLETDDELDAATRRCDGDFLQLPVHAEPVAIVVNLPGVTRLRLSPEAVRGLLDETITSWNDPAVQEDNPGLELMAVRVKPVWDAEEAATTQAVRSWLGEDGQAPEAQRSVVADGADTVASTVSRTPYSIGYVAQAEASGLRPVSIGSGGRFVLPTARGVRRLLAVSEIEEGRAPGDLAMDTSVGSSSRGYPVVVVTYVLACSRYDSDDEARLVQAYLGWVYSGEAQGLLDVSDDGARLSEPLRRRSAALVGQIGSSGR